MSSPTYKIPQRPQEATYLDVSVTYSPASREVFVNVLNRSKDTDITASIENESGAWSGPAAVWQMNHADLKATHTFGADMKVRPKTSSTTLQGGRYTFPAHSLTILKLKLS